MDNSCKVYLWKRWFSPGHIALELPNKMYISFWPRPKGQKSVLQASGTQYSAVSEEMKVNGHPSTILMVPDLDVGKMTAWWLSMADDNPKWTLTSFNCSTAVFEALCEGSAWFKNKASIMPSTPQGVANLVQEYIDEKLGVKCSSSSSSSGCVIL